MAGQLDWPDHHRNVVSKQYFQDENPSQKYRWAEGCDSSTFIPLCIAVIFAKGMPLKY